MNILQAPATLILLALAACGDPFPDHAGVNYYGKKALVEISRMGITVPPEAKDLYYHIEGFIDPTEFVSFSIGPVDAEKAVRAFSKVGFSDFAPWENQIEEKTGCREPGHFDSKDKNGLYDADSLQDAIIYSDDSKVDEGYYYIYDKAAARLFICHWTS